MESVRNKFSSKITTPAKLTNLSIITDLGGYSHFRLGLGSGLLPLALLLVWLLGISVEEQIGHHLPRHVPGDGAAQTQHLPGKEPPHQTNAVGRLCVAGNGHIDELGWGVDVAEGNDGDVGIARLSHRLKTKLLSSKTLSKGRSQKQSKISKFYSFICRSDGISYI